MIRYYWGRFWPFLLFAFVIEAVENLFTVFFEYRNMDFGLVSLLKTAYVFLTEFAVTMCYWLIPYAVYLWILPRGQAGGKADRWFTSAWFFLFVLANLFEDVAEAFFWNEFEASFNFIAVDYLVYTKEVIGNIYESYPIIPILGGILAASVLTVWGMKRFLLPRNGAVPAGWKRGCVVLFLLACVTGGYWLVDIKDADAVNNRYNSEMAKDGLYSLFSAFLKNELDYRAYYRTLPDAEAAAFLAREFTADDTSVPGASSGSVKRQVRPSGGVIRPNVVVVVMESMGAEFLNECREDGADVTPCLSRLGKEGIFFPNTYATGTRSVRGLEAISTSLPPLPGMSILRQEGNEHLQTIGSIFRDKGYDLKWIYGGYGYFDNMNYFFGNNGFQVLDRSSMNDSEVTHSTIWGVCDEDLFRRAVREADESCGRGKPFLQVVFTTSNHRPYTYPEGRIDIPPRTGRMGAVKYADYAVGAFVEEARTRPWFDNTLFVFVGDHGAGSAGKQALNPETHRIFSIFYAPALLKPERREIPVSQIDVLPTLLGLLKWPYDAAFYGKDALKPSYQSRYFVSNYQYIGYLKGKDMVVLKPQREVEFFRDGEAVAPDGRMKDLEREAVYYYQHASGWRTSLKE